MRFDLPVPDPETQPFWDATRQGKLLIMHCNQCDEPYFYPRPFCPRCWTDDVEWREASGRATLYTWSVVHNNDLPPWPDRVPYVAAVVDLEEGPRMMTIITDCDPEDLKIGMDVTVAFEEYDEDITVPVFRPA